MKMIVIIMVIIVYYFLLGFGINLILQDTLLVAANIEGNTTLQLVDTSNINMTVFNPIEGETTLRSFPNTLKIMFGFRTPKVVGFPNIIAVILSFINWFLLIIGGVAVYRIINPLATP